MGGPADGFVHGDDPELADGDKLAVFTHDRVVTDEVDEVSVDAHQGAVHGLETPVVQVLDERRSTRSDPIVLPVKFVRRCSNFRGSLALGLGVLGGVLGLREEWREPIDEQAFH